MFFSRSYLFQKVSSKQSSLTAGSHLLPNSCLYDPRVKRRITPYSRRQTLNINTPSEMLPSDTSNSDPFPQTISDFRKQQRAAMAAATKQELKPYGGKFHNKAASGFDANKPVTMSVAATSKPEASVDFPCLDKVTVDHLSCKKISHKSLSDCQPQVSVHVTPDTTPDDCHKERVSKYLAAIRFVKCLLLVLFLAYLNFPLCQFLPNFHLY